MTKMRNVVLKWIIVGLTELVIGATLIVGTALSCHNYFFDILLGAAIIIVECLLQLFNLLCVVQEVFYDRNAKDTVERLVRVFYYGENIDDVFYGS